MTKLGSNNFNYYPTGDSNSSEDDRSQAYPTDQSAISDDKRATVIKALDSITEETIAKCVNLLEKLSLPADGDESEYVVLHSCFSYDYI